MSTASRLISGSAASWSRILITMLTQIGLVPIYLTYWNVETYGVWIAIQAFILLLATLDRGHVDFLGFEFLRLGSNNKKGIGKLLSSGISMTLVIGLVEIAIVAIFCFSGLLPTLLGSTKLSSDLIWQTGWTLLLLWFGWTFFSNTAGLFFRALTPFGFYPRMAWWDVLIAIVSALTSVVVVMTGGSLIQAGIWTTLTLFITTIFQYRDLMRLLKKEKIDFRFINLKEGFKNYRISLMLSARYFLENFRQQGVRLLLAPMVGVIGLAAFSTMRTGANVALQGLSSITNPLLPELMRFLVDRDQRKTEVAFATVWLILVFALAPGVLTLQLVAAPLFQVWTKNQIVYDPYLFATLSLGVLVYASAQPAMAIIIGNNQLKAQMSVAIATAIVVIAGLLILVPSFGILGAGIALLAAEVLAAAGFIYYARRWLHANHLSWPVTHSRIAWLTVGITSAGMAGIIALPHLRWIFFGLSFSLLVWNGWRYWKLMPSFATDRAMSIFKKIPLINKIFSFAA